MFGSEYLWPITGLMAIYFVFAFLLNMLFSYTNYFIIFEILYITNMVHSASYSTMHHRWYLGIPQMQRCWVPNEKNKQ